MINIPNIKNITLNIYMYKFSVPVYVLTQYTIILLNT